MEWYITVLKNYAVFSGRARRKEYWMFFLIIFLISIAISIVGAMMGAELLGMLYSLAVFIPSLAVAVRRLHDTGRSGWWFLIALIPIVGAFILLYFLVKDSDEGENAYGENPKGFSQAASA